MDQNTKNENSELIAVITAAIAALQGEDTVMTDLVVRRIRRIPGRRPIWAAEGLQETMDSRRFI